MAFQGIVNAPGSSTLTLTSRSPSVLDHAEALDHVELLGVRREVIVDEGAGGEADRIDHQRIAFVVADGVAEPAGPGVRIVLFVQSDRRT